MINHSASRYAAPTIIAIPSLAATTRLIATIFPQIGGIAWAQAVLMWIVLPAALVTLRSAWANPSVKARMVRGLTWAMPVWAGVDLMAMQWALYRSVAAGAVGFAVAAVGMGFFFRWVMARGS